MAGYGVECAGSDRGQHVRRRGGDVGFSQEGRGGGEGGIDAEYRGGGFGDALIERGRERCAGEEYYAILVSLRFLRSSLSTGTSRINSFIRRLISFSRSPSLPLTIFVRPPPAHPLLLTPRSSSTPPSPPHRTPIFHLYPSFHVQSSSTEPSVPPSRTPRMSRSG